MCYVVKYLGAAGISYMADAMRGCGICANAFISCDRFRSGRCLALLPKDIAPLKKDEFNHAIPELSGVSLQWLCNELRERAPENATYILRMPLARPGDGVLERCAYRILRYRQEVYLSLSRDEIMSDALECAISYAENEVCSFGLLFDAGIPVPERGKIMTVSKGALENAAKTCKCAHLSAFDGDGYMLWVG